MRKWETRTIRSSKDYNPIDFDTAMLNTLGEFSWELVTVIHDPVTNPAAPFIYFLKREITNSAIAQQSISTTPG